MSKNSKTLNKSNWKQSLGLDLRRKTGGDSKKPQPAPQTKPAQPAKAPQASQQKKNNGITERQQLILLSEYAANKEVLSNDTKAALNGKVSDSFCLLCGYLARGAYREVLSAGKFSDEKIPGLLKYISNQDLFSGEVTDALSGAARSDKLFDVLWLVYNDNDLVRSVMDSEGASGARRKQAILIGYGWEAGSKLFSQKPTAIQQAKKAGVKDPKVKMYAFWATEDRKYVSSVSFEDLASLLIDQATLISKLMGKDIEKIQSGSIGELPETLDLRDIDTILSSNALVEYHRSAEAEEISTNA